MSVALRIVLIVAAVALVAVLLHSIKRSKMRIEDSLFWVAFSLVILLLSIFPEIAVAASDAFGFMAPVNFIFLFFIFVLILKNFAGSRRVSQLESRVQELAEQVAINQLDHYERSEAAAQAQGEEAREQVK